jgi:hypothetical protein
MNRNGTRPLDGLRAAPGTVEGRDSGCGMRSPTPPTVEAGFSRLQRRPLAVVCCVALLLLPGLSLAQDARQVMEEAQKRTDATSQHYEGLLQVIDAKGKITDKRWVYDRTGSHGRSKSLLTFTQPAEVKGVALLILNYPDRASDQWMWTPAIQRERRIAMQDRSTRFFGTDFSFEDLEERDTEQYDYAMAGEEPVDGVACWKVESKPRRTKSSQYTSSLVWVRKDNYAFQRIENFVQGVVARRLRYSRIENVQGIWTARVLEMADLRRNSRTVLTFEKLEYNVPMKDENFTLQALRRNQ